MRRLVSSIFLAVPLLFGPIAASQGPALPAAGLTGAAQRAPQDVAMAYLAGAAAVSVQDLPSVYLAKSYTTPHNGVTHLVYRQRFYGIDVENAVWVANVARDGRLLTAGGTLYPAPAIVNFGPQISSDLVVQSAVREVNPRLAASFVPVRMSGFEVSVPGVPASVTYAGGSLGGEVEGRLVWYAHRGTLLLAWIFNVLDADGVSSFDVAIEASSGATIHKKATTYFQSVPTGLVFDKGSPQPNPAPGVRLASAPPIVDRESLQLSGDPIASPMGWVVNNETAGYNAVVGENPLGLAFLAAPRTSAPSGDFAFPLALGPSAPNPVTFKDAANVNLFYWINRAHDLFYRYGFNESAGNFQSLNHARGGEGGDPILAYTHYGSAAPVGPSLNNAFFTARGTQDGTASMIAMYATITGPGGFFADGAYASDVIIHEYAHGVSLRLLPDGYGSFQAAAMGEAWGDFFGLEFTIPEGAPRDGVYPSGEYFSQAWGTGGRTRPYSTDTSVNPLTYASLGRVSASGPEVHADGEIWVQALWEARANLIQQFGEAEGRSRIRRLVIDGMMLTVPSPSMVDMRDAILLADELAFEGDGQEALWSAFAKRGLGALAHSDGGDSLHVIPSFDLPTPDGKLKFYEKTFVAGEPVRVLLADANRSAATARVALTTSSGDVEDLLLTRSGFVYFGSLLSTPANVGVGNGILSIIPGDVITAAYVDEDTGASAPSAATAGVQTTAQTQQPYSLFTSTAAMPVFTGETRIATVRAPVRQTLPFDFPFYSGKYRSIVVYPTGAILLEPSVFTNLTGPGCNDLAELRRIAAIAPLFLNLTFGTAQADEGIYMSTPSAGTVAFRWAAETLGASPPEPVNFAVTLASDGVITLYYGSGNQNLHKAASTLSTCGAQPVVGISNGHDVYARNVTLGNFTNAATLIFVPTFNSPANPQVVLERPEADETVRGLMRVSGVAYQPSVAPLTNVTRRDIFIDGVQRGTAAPVARPDFCAANPVPGCPAVGFQADLNIAALNLTPGSHTLKVRAMNTRGGFADSAEVSFNVDTEPASLPVAAIETPSAGDELSGSAVIRGYAYAAGLQVSRVDLLIDGVTYPGISYGAARPDVCDALPPPLPANCPNVGWSLTLNTRSGSLPLPDGAHSMQVRVLDQLGRYTLFPEEPVPFTVNNGPAVYPTGAITSILPNDSLTGSVTVSGYAYSPSGRVTSVLVLVDGAAVAAAAYGQPRPEECSSLPDVGACPNIGFTYNLDTRTLTNGFHVLGVRITNDSGFGVTVPNQVRNGMNVLVDNH